MQFYKAFATDLKLLCIQFNGEKDQQSSIYIIVQTFIYTITYLTFTCSKSTIKTLEKGAMYVQS